MPRWSKNIDYLIDNLILSSITITYSYIKLSSQLSHIIDKHRLYFFNIYS